MEYLEKIQSRIYEVRGVRVMLDFDLAALYQVENRVLKQAVRRNLDRFPEDFLIRISSEESKSLLFNGVSQIVIPLDIIWEERSCLHLQNKVWRCCRVY